MEAIMAAGTWPDVATGASGSTRTDNKLANTFERSIDQKLWAALMAKSPFLDKLSRVPIDNFKFEWVVDSAPVRTYTADGGTDTTIDTSGATSNKYISLTAVTGLEKGSLIRNASRATPVGSYGQDEIMEVVGISGLIVEVLRDANRQNSGTGSTAHVHSDVFEVIYAPKQEGSGPDANKYTDVTLVENYANTVDFYLTVTGDQAATKRIVAGDTVDNQFQKNLLRLQNDLEGMFFYGCLNNGANAGSASYVRRTKGFDAFVGASGGNYDVTTADVTADALDDLFAGIITDKTDPADPFLIVTHPQNARKISQFGIDKIRTTPESNKWGRHVDTFKSDLGVEAEVLWTLNVSKSDLFIVDMAKVSMPVFRPFTKAQWSYGDDGVDAWRQRYLGSFGVKVVDGLYSHAKLGCISWS
jgi:hypothetical protein